MPLVHGKSQKAFEKNLKTEMHAGKPKEQALAIAYSLKRRAARKASGGEVLEDEDQSPEQIEAEAEQEGEPLSQELVEDETPEQEAMERKSVLHDPQAMAKAIAAKKMAAGGRVERDDAPNLKEMYDKDEDMFSLEEPHEEHDLDALFKSDENFLSRDYMAEGGEVEDKKKHILRRVMERIHNEHKGK